MILEALDLEVVPLIIWFYLLMMIIQSAYSSV